jgi:hypothetical protein
MKTILLQLDSDVLASSFDRVVAVDAGVDELFSYQGVTPDNVLSLVHGAMFTRGVPDLKSTAIFIGGSDVQLGEKILKQVTSAFFGPVRVSVMLDSNGANTTAAAAVLRLKSHLELQGARIAVLGGTGPVGSRVAHLLAMENANVVVTSRSLERAQNLVADLTQEFSQSKIEPLVLSQNPAQDLQNSAAIIACGAAGVQFMDQATWQSLKGLKVAIDVNAVPPVGLAGINPQDKAKMQGEVTCYGALGVGSLKMKIHRTAVQKLFERNDLVLNIAELYEIGRGL